jgi:ribose 5-phosphate isomerase A
VCAETKRDACRVDAELNCIKGGGACQLREKVLAEAAKTFVCLSFLAEPVFE